jgi:DNA mismatch repair protein MutS2
MFIPAEYGTELSTFENVFADIGDEQSIEQSLSTFSSHMTNTVRILAQADDRSLVLLDELGAGTDPIEGAALAQAILEHLFEQHTLCVATTHYSEIKAFALMHPGMQNASMEFDVDRLCPTYRLFIGIPGKSNAFEISRRLGLGGDVIDRAQTFLKKKDVAFENVLSEAEQAKRSAENDRDEAKKALAKRRRIARNWQAEAKAWRTKGAAPPEGA